MLSQAEIDARLARYTATANARDLWPEVPVPVFRAAMEEVAVVTASALSGAPGPIPLRTPGGADAHSLGVAAFAGGMGPLLGWWIETGRVTAKPEVAALFAAHLEHGRRRAERLGAECERILAALAERGIEVLLLKGIHTARAYFPDPGARPLSDIDLLIAPELRASAADALRGLGLEEVESLAVPERTHWAPPGRGPVRSLDLAHADDPWSVDLHVSLGRAFLPGIRIELGRVDLAAADVWHGLSRPARVLPPPALLLHLAAHLAGHHSSMPLVRLVELVLVVRRDVAGRADRWRGFDDLVRRHGAGRFVFPALALAERLAPGTVDPRTLERAAAAAPRLLRRRVAGLTLASAQRLHTAPFRDRFLWAASGGEALRLLLDIVWPRPEGAARSPGGAARVQWRRVRALLTRLLRPGPAA